MQRSLIALLALTASAFAETHDIDVGENGRLSFDPAELRAEAGDQLRFHFYSASAPHDVVQGSFDEPGPCIPSSPDPFYSGLMEGDMNGDVTFTVNITSSDPVYFYCSIARHCQSGMVGVVNPPEGAGFTEYRNSARNVESSNRPFDGAQGGRVGRDGDEDEEEEDDEGTTSTTQTRTSTSSSTTGSNAEVATTMPTTLTGTSASPTDPATSSETEAAGSAATTTPSGAGKNGQTPIYLGLAVVLGGLVALMA